MPARTIGFRDRAYRLGNMSYHSIGHRQVTGAYLLALAQNHGGKLATFDTGIPELISVQKDRSTYLTLIR
jgi:hypothetical protein